MGDKNKTDYPTATSKPLTDSEIFLDAVMDHVALEHAERAAVFTPEEDRWAHGAQQAIERQLAALRRQLTPAQPPPKRLPQIPQELFALDRAALVARVGNLTQEQGARYHHLDLTGLTDDDLRSMIAGILKPPTEE